MRVSIVIPTYNRAARLSTLLSCIVRQRSEHALEVLVCDDGSADDTRAVARAFADRLDLKYLHQEDRGFRAGQARNLGIRAATGDIVIFVDDDVLLAPDFVDGHAAVHQSAASRRVGIGYRFRADATREAPPSAEAIRAFAEDDRIAKIGRRAERMRELRPAWILVYSCNLSVPRHAAELRFESSFVGWGIEDFELGYRLLRSGLSLQLAIDAPVLHVEDPQPRDPFLLELTGRERSYDSYVGNMVRFIDLHGADPEVARYVRNALQWYALDPARSHWVKNGGANDPDEVIARERRRMRQARVA